MKSSRKNIVLTGASKGIGFALACELARGGHSVKGCSRSGIVGRVIGFDVSPVDVSSSDQVFSWADKLIRSGHVPDIVITNAGVINEPAPLWEVPPSALDALIATNILGTAYTIQAFLPAMIARGHGGTLVTLSSGWGRSTDPGFAPYCASKFAIEGLTLSLAKELPENITAVTLNPGVVKTDMLLRCWGERALAFEEAGAWATRAAPFILGLKPNQNGEQLTVPAP